MIQYKNIEISSGYFRNSVSISSSLNVSLLMYFDAPLEYCGLSCD